MVLAGWVGSGVVFQMRYFHPGPWRCSCCNRLSLKLSPDRWGFAAVWLVTLPRDCVSAAARHESLASGSRSAQYFGPLAPPASACALWPLIQNEEPLLLAGAPAPLTPVALPALLTRIITRHQALPSISRSTSPRAQPLAADRRFSALWRAGGLGCRGGKERHTKRGRRYIVYHDTRD